MKGSSMMSLRHFFRSPTDEKAYRTPETKSVILEYLLGVATDEQHHIHHASSSYISDLLRVGDDGSVQARQWLPKRTVLGILGGALTSQQVATLHWNSGECKLGDKCAQNTWTIKSKKTTEEIGLKKLEISKSDDLLSIFRIMEKGGAPDLCVLAGHRGNLLSHIEPASQSGKANISQVVVWWNRMPRILYYTTSAITGGSVILLDKQNVNTASSVYRRPQNSERTEASEKSEHMQGTAPDISSFLFPGKKQEAAQGKDKPEIATGKGLSISSTHPITQKPKKKR